MLINIILYLNQQEESNLKMILLIHTPEVHRKPVFILLATTCDIDQTQF